MILYSDFVDFIKALNDTEVNYLLVGGYSVVLHGYSRNTGDMDIWVEKTEENYAKLVKAFYIFGMPLFDMTLENFTSNIEFDVFTFGRPPISIDIMTNVKGLNFNECFKDIVLMEVDGITIKTISLNNLLIAKKAANRAKDINDIEHLT